MSIINENNQSDDGEGEFHRWTVEELDQLVAAKKEKQSRVIIHITDLVIALACAIAFYSIFKD